MKKQKKKKKNKGSKKRRVRTETKRNEPAKKVIELSEEKRFTQNYQKKTEVKRSEQGGKNPIYYIKKGIGFVQESQMELRKVKWPTKKELIASTAMVLFLVLIVAGFLGLVDLGLIKIIKNIIR